jgi:N-acyl amino acid synthase of PEP-CTERM/exosortase system
MFDVGLLSFESSCAEIPCADAAAAAPANILTRYNKYFRSQRADTPAMVRTAHAIRYQVYCLERKFENAAEHSDCQESDAFDGLAIHSLVFHRPTSDAIGTARLILPRHSPIGLPIERLLSENGLRAKDHFPLETVAEVSRFSISSQFRRRCNERDSAVNAKRERESSGVLPCLGLLQDLLRQSVALDLTHWAAVMEPKFLRMLAAMGIYTTSVGPLVSYHGLRQPSYCYLPEMLERLRRERPDHWSVVTDGGTLVPAEARHPPEKRLAA